MQITLPSLSFSFALGCADCDRSNGGEKKGDKGGAVAVTIKAWRIGDILRVAQHLTPGFLRSVGK